MKASASLKEGFRRVNGAPALVAGTCTLTLLVALPLAIALRGMLEAHLGHSLISQNLAAGGDYDWWQEFLNQASGLGTTFTQSIAGPGAVLSNLSGLLDNEPLAATIAGVTVAWMLIWSFMTGGILDRLARDRRLRSAGFFAACGAHVWRLFRLGLIAALVYYALFTAVHPAIFDAAYPLLTLDATAERTAFAVRAAGYVIFGVLLLFCSLLFDYARIRIVVEDRRSAVAALGASVRFVRRNLAPVLALYLLNALLFLALVSLYGLMAPSIPGEGAALWAALLLGQAYIVGRHYLKLLFYASQCAMFQGALAHAPYTGPPPVVWPESPAVEAIINAEPTT